MEANSFEIYYATQIQQVATTMTLSTWANVQKVLVINNSETINMNYCAWIKMDLHESWSAYCIKYLKNFENHSRRNYQSKTDQNINA